MTKALLNNLSITIEKNVNLTEKMPKKEGLDFGKLFESKKDNLYQKTDNFKPTETQVDTAQKNENNKKTLADIKDALKTNNTNQNNTSENNVQNNNADNSTDIGISKDCENSNTQISNTENTTTEEINLTEEYTDNTTITEEEPTMYNELNTLEDPTTILLLQTQIQKNIKNCLENEPLDDFSDENATLNNNSALTNNTTLFNKQFESNISKDTNINVNQFTQFATSKEITPDKSSNSKISNLINENIVKELNVEVVSSQSSEMEGNFGDLMQNQSPQEQAARAMIQGDVKFETLSANTLKTVQVKPADITPSKIIEQIYKQLDGMVNNSKLNIVLNPGSLGKVNLQLMNTKDGLTAQFTVTTQDAKDILMKGLDGLKENLLAQGVNVDSVSVKLNETDNEYNLDYTEQENSNNEHPQKEFKQKKEDEQTFEQVLEANNGIDNEENAEG